MKERSIIGIDLAKNVFQLHAEDAAGHVLWRKRLRREELARFLAKQPPSLIGMEACGSAHHWGRVLSGQGHEVRLMHAKYVKAYVKRFLPPGHPTACAEASIRSRFRQARSFQNHLHAVRRPRPRVYRDAKVEADEKGLRLFPSRPPVPLRQIAVPGKVPTWLRIPKNRSEGQSPVHLRDHAGKQRSDLPDLGQFHPIIVELPDTPLIDHRHKDESGHSKPETDPAPKG
jgi:hypothetical protein